MSLAKFERITLDSILDQDCIVRKFDNDNYQYFKITGYDNNTERYILESFTGLPESRGYRIETTTNYLITNFEKLVL